MAKRTRRHPSTRRLQGTRWGRPRRGRADARSVRRCERGQAAVGALGVVRRERPQHLGGDDRISAEVDSRGIAGPARVTPGLAQAMLVRSVAAVARRQLVVHDRGGEVEPRLGSIICPTWPQELAPDPQVMRLCAVRCSVSIGCRHAGQPGERAHPGLECEAGNTCVGARHWTLLVNDMEVVVRGFKAKGFAKQGERKSVGTSRSRRSLGVLLGATIAAASIVGVAGADDISNNLDATHRRGGRGRCRSTSVEPNGTTQLYVVTRGTATARTAAT